MALVDTIHRPGRSFRRNGNALRPHCGVAAEHSIGRPLHCPSSQGRPALVCHTFRSDDREACLDPSIRHLRRSARGVSLVGGFSRGGRNGFCFEQHKGVRSSSSCAVSVAARCTENAGSRCGYRRHGDVCQPTLLQIARRGSVIDQKQEFLHAFRNQGSARQSGREISRFVQ